MIVWYIIYDFPDYTLCQFGQTLLKYWKIHMKDCNGMMVSFFVILFADNIDTPSDGKVIAAQ